MTSIKDQIEAARALADAAGAAEKLDGPVGEFFRIGFATNGAAEMLRLCSSLERACELLAMCDGWISADPEDAIHFVELAQVRAFLAGEVTRG